MSKDAPKAPVKAFPFPTSPKITPKATEQDRERARAIAVNLEAEMRRLGVITTAHYETGIPLIAEALAAERERAIAVIAHVRAHYGTDIFEADGITLEAWHARWARNLLGGIIDDIRAGQPAEGEPK